MSISEKFRTWAEMDTEDDFIQYLERLVSGNPSLSAASTGASRAEGINRPLSRLAHNTDAILQALIATKTMFMTADNSDEDTAYIDFGSTDDTLVFSGNWKFMSIAPLEEGVMNVGFSVESSIDIGDDNVVYAIVDRSSSIMPTATLLSASGFTSLRSTMRAGSTPFTDYEIIGYSQGNSPHKVIHLVSGVSIQAGERISGKGFNSIYGSASTQRSNSGTSAQIQCDGDVTWDQSSQTLSWTNALKFYIPGLPKHEITAGSYSFSGGHNRAIYFDVNRDASGTETIDPSTDIHEKMGGNIDIDGHDGEDIVLIGRCDNDSSCFTFSDGHVVSDGTEIILDESPVVTFSVKEGSAAAEETLGNVGIAVSGADGLHISMDSGGGALNDTANLSLHSLWHDRCLSSMACGLLSPSTSPIVLRAICDTSGSDGHLFLSHNYTFAIPGYYDSSDDPTRFRILLDKDPTNPGLTLTDTYDTAWIILPERGTTRAAMNYSVGASETSSTSEIHEGKLSEFPSTNPNAYIIAYRVDSAWDSRAPYSFMGVSGIVDGQSMPVFTADRYRVTQDARRAQGAGWGVSENNIIEFGWDESGTYTSSPDMYYLRLAGSDANIEYRRPGYRTKANIIQGDGTTNGTGTTGKVIWEIANASPSDWLQEKWVYLDVNLAGLASHSETDKYELETYDEYGTPSQSTFDDQMALFGCLHFGRYDDGTSPSSATSARFVLWNGVSLDLNGETSVEYAGTPSGLRKEIHDALDTALDGGVMNPDAGNPFATESITDAIDTRVTTIESDYVTEAELDDFGSGHSGGAKIKTGVLNVAMGPYVPFLNWDKLEDSGGFSPTVPIYQVISGFDHIYSDNNSSNSGQGADRIYYNGGMVIFGDTFLFDKNGQDIDLNDTDHWLGSKGNTNLTNDTHRANHCLELRESVWYGEASGYRNGGVWDIGVTPTTPTHIYGHLWRVNSGNGSDPYNVVWGRNYIYIRPNPTGIQDNGNTKVGVYVEAKVSKWPPEYSSASGSTGHGQGTRTFGTDLHSDGFGDDEGTWLCIGSVYMYARLTLAEWLAASSYISISDGDDDGTGKVPQAGGFSVASDLLNPEDVRCLAFSKQGKQVTFESPMPIHHNLYPEVDDVWQDGVRAHHPSADSNGDPGASVAELTGGYNRDKGNFPNTGVDLVETSGSMKYNSTSHTKGANLNLEPLMPELPIGKVDFRLTLAVDQLSTSDEHYGCQLQIKQGFAGRTRISGRTTSHWEDLEGSFARVWYVENGQHDHGGGTAADNLQNHFHAEFSIAGLENSRAVLWRTEVDTASGSSPEAFFERLGNTNATPQDQECLGIYITGYTENFNGQAAYDNTGLNFDVDEDGFDDQAGVADLQGKYGTWNDDT